MPVYKNGYIPESLLVIFNRGANTVDGAWYHGLPPATYARHLALVDKAYARTGRTLEISDGWGAYRPYAAQLIARQIHGNGAASPGTSSHGGIWEGRQTAAMDYSNWGWVYGWDRGAFAADCAAVGLTANMIVPARGYPDEPWHVIDLDPWSAVPSSSASVPFPGAAPIQTGVADMLIFNGVSNPDQFYIAVYDGRNFKVRPTFGLESKLLRNAVPQVPRAQFLDDEVVDLAAQGGYRFDVERGVGVDADGREYVF